MSTKLHISDELSLPLDIITLRQAIYGTSGSGKTTYARLLAEKVHEAGQRFCAIDLKNDWWGLKSSADGQSAGIPIVIFGGPRRDVQLFEDGGAVVADTITSIDQSVIVDLDALSRFKQQKFLTAFLDRMYEANRMPLMLLADEADRYAPQKPMSQEAVMSLSASEDICRRGRKRGIGSTWLTQRTAVLNKNVSDLCDLTVVFRTPGSRDLDELQDRVGRIADKRQTSEVMRMAPGLADGQAIFLSSHPKLRKFLPDPVKPIQLPLPWTFDSSATPSVGQRRKEPKVLAQADLAAIETRMAQQVEQAKANDPVHLKRRVAELERQLAQRPKEQVENTVEKIVEVPVLKNGQLDRTEKIAGRFEQSFEKLIAEAEKLKAESSELRRLIAPAAAPRPVLQSSALPRPASLAVRPSVRRAPAARAAPAAGDDESSGELTGTQQKILDTILMLGVRGIPARRESVARWLAIHPNGGRYGTDLARLRKDGFIDGFALTDTGRASARELATGFDAALSALPDGTQRAILQTVADAEKALSRDELAEMLGIHPNGGRFGSDLAWLRTMGLIPERGSISITEGAIR